MAYGSKTSKAIASVSKAITKPKVTKPLDNTLTTGFIPTPTNFRGTQNDEQLVLSRDVFDKIAFNNTVNTSFSELDQIPPDLSFFDPNLATVNDFFNIYQSLFFQIPKFGETNSHEYLVIESTDYSKVIENQEQIDALLEEIVDLREQNLQLQLDINELLGVKTTLDQAIQQSGEGSNLEDLLQQQADLGAEQSNSSSDNLSTPNVQDRPVNNPGVGNPTAIGGGGGGGNFIPGVTSGFTNEFNSQFGDPLPSFGFGGSNINPGNQVY